MEQHTVIGDRLCGELRALHDVRPIVRHHHERDDGSGYPDGLTRDATPLLARIMSVVDAFDAMTTDRPYKPARTTAGALEELRVEVRKGWRSGELVEALAAFVAERVQ
jgi:putative two-component system response regulator